MTMTAADTIYVYTRAQALADGVLIDVSEMAGAVGFRYPVAVTAALWADIEAIPPQLQGVQDVPGRLWDVLWLARCAAQRSRGSMIVYDLIMHVGDRAHSQVKLVCGPGDDGAPVMTLMRVHAD